MKIKNNSQASILNEFKVELSPFKAMLGRHVNFFSEDKTIALLSFSWWDHADADLREMTLEQVPGVFEEFNDCEQGWEINISEQSGFKQISIGDFEEPGVFKYTFQVSADLYLSAWSDLLNNISKLPGTFKTIQKAVIDPSLVLGLNLSRFNSKTLPDEVRAFNQLEFMSLFMSSIESLPDWITEFKSLKYIDLRFCDHLKLSARVSSFLKSKGLLS